MLTLLTSHAQPRSHVSVRCVDTANLNFSVGPSVPPLVNPNEVLAVRDPPPLLLVPTAPSGQARSSARSQEQEPGVGNPAFSRRPPAADWDTAGDPTAGLERVSW